jgi:general secretion pathway protein D
VIIAEVTLNNTDKSGISALNLTVGTDTPATGDNGRGTHITNFAGAIPGWQVTEGVVNPLAFKAALDSTSSGSRSNLKVLQAPTIVTTHAKEGRVVVGSEVPYVSSATSSLSTGNTGDVTNQSVSFKEINLDLKVTPLIGIDGSIQLTIDQLIKDQIGTATINGNPTPVIGTRQATSTVNIVDGQMIVLGGLQRTSLNNSRAKIGFIYEIPILSQLLGARTSSTDRTELLLFIRPHVLKPEQGTDDVNKTIDTLSNKEQINQYLKDPSTTPKQKLFDKWK